MNTMIVAKAVIIDEQNRVLLLRRSPADERRPGEQDFPGGGIEPGEEFTAGVAREIFEEAGLTVDIKNLQLFYSATEAHANRSVTRLLFWTKVNHPSIKLSHEHDDYHWASPAQVAVEFPHPVYATGLAYAIKHNLFLLA